MPETAGGVKCKTINAFTLIMTKLGHVRTLLVQDLATQNILTYALCCVCAAISIQLEVYDKLNTTSGDAAT